MKTLELQLPDSLELSDHELKMILASRLYESGKLSLGQAAALAGYSKWTFIELLGEYGVSFINYSADDLERELEHDRTRHR